MCDVLFSERAVIMQERFLAIGRARCSTRVNAIISSLSYATSKLYYEAAAAVSQNVSPIKIIGPA